MPEIVLFHHIQGLTPGITAFAERLRTSGHTIHTPDLFDGATFLSIDEGVAHAGAVGFGNIIDRGVSEAEVLRSDVVYMGFSMGVMPAQKLAQTRPGTLGAVLIDACLPTSEFGDGWPGGVPVQVHGMDADPFFAGEGDIDAARALVDTSDNAELFVYPGDVHLFADSSLPSYDPQATDLMAERVLEFLSRLG